MESFATLIKNRRSIRKFTGQLLNPDQVEMILKAALMAPASKRKTPWQFVVVEDKEMLVKLSACKPAGAAFLKDCGSHQDAALIPKTIKAQAPTKH